MASVGAGAGGLTCASIRNEHKEKLHKRDANNRQQGKLWKKARGHAHISNDEKAIRCSALRPGPCLGPFKVIHSGKAAKHGKTKIPLCPNI